MIRQLLGRDWIDLEPLFDVAAIAALDEEICRGLVEVDVGYTGGSHRSLGIVPPSHLSEPGADYGEVIARMERDEFCAFAALGDWPDVDPDRRHAHHFGEERELPLSRKQMRFLSYRHGVYFPWKAYYEMIPNERWEDKSRGTGKAFTDEARRWFPRTVAFVEELPFIEIGRCNLMGLEPNDHGTVHRDGDPADKPGADHFITLCPRANKRLYLWDEERRRRVFLRGRAYWFDDSNYHGVAADPWFRYSIRVDGVFCPDFLGRIAS
jgi:hypothetical protein